MRCPKCNQAMTQVGKFWVCPEHGSVQVEETKSQRLFSALPEEHPLTSLVNELPFPLALALSEYVREDNPFVKLHRLADVAELLTRFVTMILLSDVLRQRGEFPESLRNALVDKIERPTFGAWRVLLYEANNHLPKKKGKVKCFLTQLPVYVNKHLLPSLGSGEGDHTKHIIALRNLLAHAGRLPDERAQDLLEHHKKAFEALMEKLSFITDYTPITCTDEGRVLSLRGLPQSDGSFPEYDASQLSQSPQKGRVLLIYESEVLNLFPLHAFIEVLQWREEEIVHIAEPVPQLYFRMNNKGYLEFTTLSDRVAFSQQCGEALERFREIFRLEEWRRLTEDEQQLQEFSFDKLVKEMTEVFVGREENVHKVKACLKAKESGVLFISGEPGVGKTALMAKIVKDYRGAPHYVTIPYFFRTGHTTCSTDQFLKAALLRLHTELNEPLEISTTLEERRKQFVEAVQTANNQLDKKILFLVDGMDEIYRIDSSFISLPFTINASNVVWLCAGRSEKALEESLRHNGAEWVFPNGLAKLDEQGIRTMLTAHLDRLKYQLFARDEVEQDESGKEEYRNRFIEVLVSKSEGLPLYVQMIIEDLREGKWTLEDEDKLPDGLIDYFDQILERLRVSDVGTVLTPLFCLLAWAKEPVTESALKLLLSEHHLSQTEGWEELFRKALSHGHLMLRSARTPEGEAGWTFYHETFRQHLMTTQAVSTNREWAQATWLRWCEQWQTLEEESLHRYILRNYAEHLRESKRWNDLFALARDEVFSQVQTTTISDVPDLPLRTVQTALQGAAEVDNARTMAEFLLTHARKLMKIKQESPLDALRAGHLERAWELADLYDIKRCVLWHLLITWELKDTGRLKKARATLKRLLVKDLPRLSGWSRVIHEYVWEGNYAIDLLAYVSDIDKEALLLLSQRLLDDFARIKLCESLAARGDLPPALQVAQEFEEGWRKASALRYIAEAQARTGKIVAALETIQRIDRGEKNPRVEALIAIAKAQVKVGKREEARTSFSVAFETAQQIDEPHLWAEMLKEIAVAQAQVGEIAAALKIIQKPQWIDETFFSQEIAQWCLEIPRVKALGAIATAQAQAGEITAAFETVQEIEETKSIVCTVPKAQALAAIQVQMGEKDAAQKTLTTALKTACRAYGFEQMSEALGAIAKMQAQMGERDALQKTLTVILETSWPSYANEQLIKALLEIVIAQTQAGEHKEAQVTFAIALDNAFGQEELRQIAVTQAQVGETAAARATFATALKTTAQEISESNRAKVLAEVGEFADALNTARRIEYEEYEWKQAEALKKIAEAQAQTEEREAAQSTFATALQTVQKIDIEDSQEELGRKLDLLRILERQARAGFGKEAVQTLETIITTDGRDFLRITEALAEMGDKENFKRLLIPCAYYLDAAYRMCGLLARLYPEQASAIAEMVKDE